MDHKKRLFYGWYVAAACFIFELAALGLGIGTGSLYFKPVCDEMGFSRGAFSVVFSIMSAVNMVVCVTFGFVHKRIGARTIFLLGALFEGGAFAIYSVAGNIYLFYAGSVLMGIGLMYLGTIPLSLVITNWFVEKKGFVLGLVFAGSGIGGTILNPLVSGWIASYGWRTSYRISLLIVLAACVPALFLIRERPADMGLEAFGAAAKNKEPEAGVSSAVGGFTWKEAIKKKTFWLLISAALLFGMSIQPVFLSSPAYLADSGISLRSIGLIMSVIYFLNLLGKIVLGMINDKLGIRPVILISHGSFLIATGFLLFTTGTGLAFVFAAFFGIAAVALTIPIPLLTGILFGQKNYGTLLGIVMGAYTIGVSIGTPLNGLSYDLFNSYRYAYIAQIALDAISAALIFTALRLR